MWRHKSIENFYLLFVKSENFERVIIGKVNASQSSEGGVKGPTNVREDVLFPVLVQHLLLGTGVEQGSGFAVEQERGRGKGGGGCDC